jgi:fermentation-respiration switch protein FrsA (DUF1100 family)
VTGNVRVDRTTIAGHVPAIVHRPLDGAPHPAVVTVHGGGQSKDVVGPNTVRRVVERGVALVAVDLYLHGDHVDERAATLGVGYETLLEVVSHTARDLVAAVAELAADAEIVPDCIALRGESLGAYAALVAVGLGAPVARALSIAGAADFEATLAHALAAEGIPPDEALRERERLRPAIAAIDPRRRLDAFEDCALLMIHGTADEVVPIAAHRSLYDALARARGASGPDCVFVTHSGGHVAPRSVDDLGWEWLLRGLIGGVNR